MKKTAVVLFSAMFLYAGVFAGSKAPKWLSGTSQDYPEKEFMLGVGESSSLSSAKDAARAEIGKVFETRIEQMAKETQKESSSDKNGRNKTVSEQSVELQTQSYTNQLLEGVNISETWFDEKNRRHYALAVLNKKKMSAELAGKLLDEEEIIKTQLDVAQNSANAVDKIKAYSLALSAYERKDSISTRKRIVDPVAVPDLPSVLSKAEIFKRRNDAALSIGFSVVDESFITTGLKEVVAEVLTKAGFKVGPGTGATSIIVKCALEMKPVDRANANLKFVSWTGKIELVSNDAEKKVLASNSPLGQVSSINEDSANQKAVLTGNQAVKVAFEKMLQDYFFGN